MVPLLEQFSIFASPLSTAQSPGGDPAGDSGVVMAVNERRVVVAQCGADPAGSFLAGNVAANDAVLRETHTAAHKAADHVVAFDRHIGLNVPQDNATAISVPCAGDQSAAPSVGAVRDHHRAAELQVLIGTGPVTRRYAEQSRELLIAVNVQAGNALMVAVQISGEGGAVREAITDGRPVFEAAQVDVVRQPEPVILIAEVLIVDLRRQRRQLLAVGDLVRVFRRTGALPDALPLGVERDAVGKCNALTGRVRRAARILPAIGRAVLVDKAQLGILRLQNGVLHRRKAAVAASASSTTSALTGEGVRSLLMPPLGS